jgi:lipopolysaccharide transport system ATP-binding protein
MTQELAVSAQELGKLYLLYKQPQDRLKQSILGRLGRNYAQTFWALRNVSFEVRRGEALGIIGRNGSGKSTLLQILAGTSQPTEGHFITNGRLTALLELGAGFNMEFTGRENILLNGATLGIPEREMRRLSEKVIDFAQIGEFIDQPVKIYSSGMFVRLAFAIATAVDPDILIIDEALAVGDMGFVFKCMNRMKQMREQGATIILVTHDIQTVRSFCDQAIWLNQGQTAMSGSPVDVTSRYMEFLFSDQSLANTSTIDFSFQEDSVDFLSNHPDLVRWGSGELIIERCAIDNGRSNSAPVFNYGDHLNIRLSARAIQEIPSTQIGLGFAFRNSKGLDVITATTYEEGTRFPALKQGQAIDVIFSLDNILAAGDYALVVNAENRDQITPRYYDFVENPVIFKVISDKLIHSLVLPILDLQVKIHP